MEEKRSGLRGPRRTGRPSPRRAFPRCHRAGRRGRNPGCPLSDHPCARVSPVPNTASKPTSCDLVEPWRSTWSLPVSVAIVPPIVALSRRRGPPRGPAGRMSGAPDRRDRRPGAHDSTAEGVDVGDARQPAQAEHNLAGEGNASADEPRVAPLGYQGGSGLFAHGDDGRHLSAVTGTDDGARMTSKPPSPVDAVRGRHLGIDDHVRGPNCRAKLLQQV